MDGGVTHVQLGALDVAYRASGRGVPLVMFHGREGDHRVYNALQDALGDKVFSVSFDQRDCGSTRWVAPAPASYSLRDVAGDAVALMASLGYERFHVLGNSLGGLLAQHLASHWPDRVDHLVLGLCWPGHSSLRSLYPTGIMRRAELSALGPAGDRDIAELMSSPEYVASHPELIARLADLTTMPSAQASARRQEALVAAEPIDPSEIQARTLVIAAERDQMVPPHIVQSLSDAIPGSAFRLIRNAGHLAALEAPDEIAALVSDFIAD